MEWLPEVGCINVPRMVSNVLLPDPDGPRSAAISPLSNRSDRLRKTRVSASPEPKVLTRFSTCNKGSVIGRSP
jgi:hypothetical protein